MRAVSDFTAARRARCCGLSADDRRRDRGQAAGRAYLAADQALGGRCRRGGRGRCGRGDGVPARAGQARRRGGGCRRRCRAAGRTRTAGLVGDHGRDPVRGQRRRGATGGRGASAREPARPPPRAAGADVRSAGIPGPAAGAGGELGREPSRRPAHPRGR